MRATLQKYLRAGATVAGLVLSLTLASAARADSQTLYKKTLQSTGWINARQPDGMSSMGTCWVVDREQRLVITNKHVVDQAATVEVDFPIWRDGQLVTRVQEYAKLAPIAGRVLAIDEKRDLALCQLESLPAGVEALPLARTSASRQNMLLSVGNSSAATPVVEKANLWRMCVGRAEERYFEVVTFTHPPQRLETNSVRGTLPTAGGDSGGPVVNTRGELVGVHSSGGGGSSYSIDVSEVRTFLERSLQPRRGPAARRDVVGTWTVAASDAAGPYYFSLTVRDDGTCLVERVAAHEGTLATARDGKTRLSVPGLNVRTQLTLTWTGDDQFTYTVDGVLFTATRR